MELRAGALGVLKDLLEGAFHCDCRWWSEGRVEWILDRRVRALSRQYQDSGKTWNECDGTSELCLDAVVKVGV